MKDGKPVLLPDVYSLSSTYTMDEKQEWVFMNLADALKITYAFEPCDLVGRFFMADVDMVTGRQDPSKKYANINAYSYRYSRANDELPPVPEAKEEAPATYAETPAIDIDEDEMPF